MRPQCSLSTRFLWAVWPVLVFVHSLPAYFEGSQSKHLSEHYPDAARISQLTVCPCRLEAKRPSVSCQKVEFLAWSLVPCMSRSLPWAAAKDCRQCCCPLARALYAPTASSSHSLPPSRYLSATQDTRLNARTCLRLSFRCRRASRFGSLLARSQLLCA